MGSRTWVYLIAQWLWVAAPGCGPESPPEELAWQRLRAELQSTNGLSTNGLSTNGLSTNGLSSGAFSAWFADDPVLASSVMAYIVRCAVPAGETRSYTDIRTGQRYTWSGGLGLAPAWASGAVAPLLEQRIITACLLAHVNSFGEHIPISILGRSALGALISFTQDELEAFQVKEACFFGNLFTPEGLFFGTEQSATPEPQYLTRACAGLGNGSAKGGTGCEPLTHVGECAKSCAADPQGPFYSQCAREGVSYPALTTRMRQSDHERLLGGSP